MQSLPAVLRAASSLLVCLFGSLVLGLASCGGGGGGSDEVEEAEPQLVGSLHLGGRAFHDFDRATVSAIAADGAVVAQSELRRNGQFAFDADRLRDFVGRIEVGVTVATAKGEQTVVLARDVDLTPQTETLPLLWVGPVSTLASRYRRLHPETSILAAEQLARQLLVVPDDVDANSGLGDSHRSPFSWSLALAEFEASASATLDEHVDGIVADMGGSGVRSYRKLPANPALHAALYGSASSDSGQGVLPKGEAGFWTKQLGELPNDLHYSLDAKFVAPGVGWLLHQAGILPSPPSNEELLQELEQIQETIAEMQADAVSDTYQIAWQNSMQRVGPACLRIDAYTQQWSDYLSGLAPSPQLAGLALRAYAAAQANGMRQDFYTLSDMLVGRGAANGPLVSILAANMMLEKFGIQAPDADALFLPLRTNELLDELRTKQDYYLGYLMLSMNLLMEWAHLDPYAFPYQDLVDGQNIQFQNLEQVRQMQTGEPNAFPVGSRPGYAADITAAQQLVPPSTLGSDWILADVPGSGSPARPNYWYMNCWYVVGNTWSNAKSARAGFSLGPWPAGSFRIAWIDELLALRDYALRAVPGDVRGGLAKLGFVGLPPQGADFFVSAPYDDASLQPDNNEFWLLNMDTGNVDLYTQSVPYIDFVLFVRYGPSGGDPATNPNGLVDDAGTAVVCRNPASLSLATAPGPSFPPGIDANYPSVAALNPGIAGTQAVGDVAPYGGAATDAFSTRSRLVWRPQYEVAGTQGFVVSSGLDGSTVPFLRLTSANPTGNLVGELYTGYVGGAASFLNTRAAPVSVTIPVGALAGQQATIAGAPPNTAPVLTSVMAVPSNRVFANPAQTAVRCYATGFYADSLGKPLLFKDHSVTNANGTVTWSVTSPSGLASFSTSTPNLLVLDPAQGAEQMTITVTVTANGVTKTDRQACWTKF